MTGKTCAATRGIARPNGSFSRTHCSLVVKHKVVVVKLHGCILHHVSILFFTYQINSAPLMYSFLFMECISNPISPLVSQILMLRLLEFCSIVLLCTWVRVTFYSFEQQQSRDVRNPCVISLVWFSFLSLVLSGNYEVAPLQRRRALQLVSGIITAVRCS